MSLYKTVFLADDDADDREIFMDAIHEVDGSIECRFASNGEMALQTLDNDILQKPELIFLDLNMPKVNGKELLRELKQVESLRDIPVIMYSTFFTEKDREEVKRLGAVHCLIKKTKFSELSDSLRDILAKIW